MLHGRMTRLEAVQMWVNGFNAVPIQMIAKLMQTDPDDWYEVTCPTVGDRICLIDEGEGEGEIVEVYHKTLCKVKMDNGITWRGHMSRMEVEYDDGLPMWGIMWSFSDICDEHWLDDKYGYDGIMAMSQCGFRIFKSFEFGYFFGIDGAGYDFYEVHWLPLYNARGLMWHDPKTEVAAS